MFWYIYCCFGLFIEVFLIFFQLPDTINRQPFSKSLKSSSVLYVNVNQLMQCIILMSL